MPPAERKPWFDGLRQLPWYFRRQRPCGPYILDFYCAQAALVIELDGESHDSVQAQANDAVRTTYLQGLGLRVLRFSNAEVMSNLEGVIVQLRELLEHATPPSASLPPPLPAGEARPCLPYKVGEVARSAGGVAEEGR